MCRPDTRWRRGEVAVFATTAVPSTRTDSPLPAESSRFSAAVEFRNPLIDFPGEIEIPVDITLSRVIRIGADREVLPPHPFQNALALGRVIAACLHLLHQRLHL